MTDDNAIYISSISGGKCIENTQKDKQECRLRKWIKTPAQQWVVEQKDGDPNTVALKSVSDQQYLAALQPDENGGKIGVLAEKQFWTLEPGLGPNWFHVKSNATSKGGTAGYLNDEWGRWRDDNKLQTYQYESNKPQSNTFYFAPAQAADDVKPIFSAGAGGDGQVERKEDLDAREQKLKERETAAEESEQSYVKNNKELKDKEAELAKREEALAQKEKDSKAAGASKQDDDAKQKDALKEREAAVAKREEELAQEQKLSKTASDSNKDQDAKQRKVLEEKESALKKREEALAQKEKDIKTASAPKQDDSGDQKRALEEKEAALARREAELERREKEIKSAQSASSSAPEATPQSTPQSSAVAQSGSSNDEDIHELCRLLRENDALKLKVKIGDLEAQLRDRACTHKIKRPPRKINYQVEGYVYRV